MSNVIKSERVRVEAGRPLAAEGRECRRSARLVQVDGVARAIEVQCTCGETMLVELAYAGDETGDGDDPPVPAAP